MEVVARGSAEAAERLSEFVRKQPKEAVRHVREIAALLDSSKTPARTASIETLAVLSRVAPGAMAFLLPKLHALLSNDPQAGVANHAIEILGNYGKTSAHAAKKVLPILKQFGEQKARKVSSLIEELSEKFN